jgi:GntR family transcriptional regulator, carbon starvation induced regulator
MDPPAVTLPETTLSPPPPGKASKETLASAVYERLRQDILTVALPPGSKLNIRELSERFNVGLSPIREALSRLTMERFVTLIDHRGFTVAPLSEGDLVDLTHARCSIDGMALRQSIAAGDEAWEERLLVAHHRLARTPRFGPGDQITRSPAWEQAHRAFHLALGSGSGSRWIMEISAQLFEAAERYRHLARLGGRSDNRTDEHKPIMEAALARDADGAVDGLTRHYKRTESFVIGVLRGTIKTPK